MAKRWNTKAAVEADVTIICKLYAQSQSLPPQLVESYIQVIDSVNGWRPGLVIHFFETLQKQCPDVMRYFEKLGKK